MISCVGPATTKLQSRSSHRGRGAGPHNGRDAVLFVHTTQTEWTASSPRSPRRAEEKPSDRAFFCDGRDATGTSSRRPGGPRPVAAEESRNLWPARRRVNAPQFQGCLTGSRGRFRGPPAPRPHREKNPGRKRTLAGCGQAACSIARMRSRERCCRENRRFSCLEKVPEDFFRGQRVS